MTHEHKWKRDIYEEAHWFCSDPDCHEDLEVEEIESRLNHFEILQETIWAHENDTACLPEDFSVTEYVTYLKTRLEEAEKCMTEAEIALHDYAPNHPARDMIERYWRAFLEANPIQEN